MRIPMCFIIIGPFPYFPFRGVYRADHPAVERPLEAEGSDLSRKVQEAVPVHLVLVWSKSEGRRPSYGQKTKFSKK